MPEIECLVDAGNALGEGPIWNPREQAIYWADSKGRPRIQRLDPKTGSVDEWEMPDLLGSFVFREQGGIVAGLKSGFHFVDPETGAVDLITDPEPGLADNRLNDGKCDRMGRYWCGSLDDSGGKGGSLYRLDPDLTCHKMDTGITVSNGIAWSPDNNTMYYSDSRSRVCYNYDFDIATGAISNKRVFTSTADLPGSIDGATIDADGYYWCAHIHDWQIAKYDPAGTIVDTIRLPVRYPTMCTFGGKDLDILYVTSAKIFVQDDEKDAQPQAGGLFAIHGTGAKGIAEPFFAG
jgi:sugar lactone lactonase YvrE